MFSLRLFVRQNVEFIHRNFRPAVTSGDGLLVELRLKKNFFTDFNSLYIFHFE